jgi:hypothetical protein
MDAFLISPLHKPTRKIWSIGEALGKGFVYISHGLTILLIEESKR